MTKFPLPAASTGEVTASADDLVVPVSHAVDEHPSRPSLLVPSVALAADASRLAAIHDKDMTLTPGSVSRLTASTTALSSPVRHHTAS
jgi:hypothetical protein